jgi:hypothetical protein
MFHPLDHPLERGWVGRVDGDRVVQLAAQTLQSFFTGGGSAREHAVFPLEAVRLLAPVLHPPSVRIFEDEARFAFANPAAIVGPGSRVVGPSELTSELAVVPRLTAVIGARGTIAGFTVLAEWRARFLAPPKDRDFALGLGPVVVTRDDYDEEQGFDWDAAIARAGENTVLYPGDLIAAPARESRPADPGSVVEIDVDGIGILEQRVAG